MPELRQDPISKHWVVIATERAARPDSFRAQEVDKEDKNVVCPFCYGNEGLTPPETYAIRTRNNEPDTSGWKIRVVPNKFPAFATCKLKLDSNKIYTCQTAKGAHEVVVSSPDHFKDFPSLPRKQIELIIKTFISRSGTIAKDKEIKYVLIIHNHGKKAGASLSHPHSQLFATPVVPPIVEDELERTKAYFQKNKKCVFCQIVKEERRAKTRIVVENSKFIAFCPYASRLPFETWITPKKHQASFQNLNETEIRDFAEILKKLLSKLRRKLGDVSYNFYIHTSPSEKYSNSYHWHLELFPKLTIPAGFEMGTGIMINICPPEDAARLLRGTKAS